MTMSLTWIAIFASLLMGVGALLIFILAVKKDYFRDLEETKYQVFWPDFEPDFKEDVEELVKSAQPEATLDSTPHALEEDNHNGRGQTHQTFRNTG
jgi:nitrogen fixation-related uncharacterized protein